MELTYALTKWSKKIVTGSLILMFLLAFGTGVPSIASSQEPIAYININVNKAHDLIEDEPSSHIIILDVRNQSEYYLGHLYNAFLIPVFLLENKTCELQAHVNDKIIVYCSAGSRSALACQILVEHGFAGVYNMLGGITAWINAGYSIYTTFHYVTVDATYGTQIQIDPMLLHSCGCSSPSESGCTCPCQGEIGNDQYTVFEKNETHTLFLQQCEVNGTTLTVMIDQSLLWSYSARRVDTNRSASLFLTVAADENVSIQFYTLIYSVQNARYNLTATTNLVFRDSKTYDNSVTIIKYTSAEKSDVKSIESIRFNSSVTLSQQYAILGEIVQKIGKAYGKSGNAALSSLASSYKVMQSESAVLSKLVKDQLPEYDKEILVSYATITDFVPGSIEYLVCTWIVMIICNYFMGIPCWEVATILAPGVCALMCGGPENFLCYIPCLASIAWLISSVCGMILGYGCAVGADYICSIDYSPPPPEDGDGGGGCPFVYTWTGQQYTLDNNLMPSSEMSDGADVKDYYMFEKTLVPTYQRSSFSLYSLQLREIGNELDFVDQVKLMAVDHASDVKIAVTSEGEILTYRQPLAPLSCVDNNGTGRLNEIIAIDGNASDPTTNFEGYPGDYLVLDFGKINAENAKLILRTDMKKMVECILVQIEDSSGEWKTVDVLVPRSYWSMEAVNLAPYINENKNLTVRLFWKYHHRLDYVGLDTTSQDSFECHTATLVSAMHSTEGNVKLKLLEDDQDYSELMPGQQMQLKFLLPDNQDQQRTFILYTEGNYFRMGR